MSEPSEAADEVEPVPALKVLFLARILAMVVMMLGTLSGLHWYLAHALFDRAGFSAGVVSAGWTTTWCAFGGLFVAFIGGRVFPHTLAKVAQWVGFTWMGAFGLLLPLVAVSDLGLWGASFVTEVSPLAFAWRTALVTMVVVPGLLWGAYAARRPVTRHLEVTVPGLHPELDGFKVVQLSDVHIGETLGREFAQMVTDTTNAQDADAVVITGDMIDGSVERLTDLVAPLGHLKAKHGVFFVTGNHEYYSGGPAWEAAAARLGMTVLHNEHRVLQRGAGRLVMAGVTDLEGARFSAFRRAGRGRGAGQRAGGRRHRAAGPPAPLRPPRQGEGRGADAGRAHARRADRALQPLRAAAAAGAAGVGDARWRADVHLAGHRVLGASVSGGHAGGSHGADVAGAEGGVSWAPLDSARGARWAVRRIRCSMPLRSG